MLSAILQWNCGISVILMRIVQLSQKTRLGRHLLEARGGGHSGACRAKSRTRLYHGSLEPAGTVDVAVYHLDVLRRRCLEQMNTNTVRHNTTYNTKNNARRTIRTIMPQMQLPDSPESVCSLGAQRHLTRPAASRRRRAASVGLHVAGCSAGRLAKTRVGRQGRYQRVGGEQDLQRHLPHTVFFQETVTKIAAFMYTSVCWLFRSRTSITPAGAPRHRASRSPPRSDAPLLQKGPLKSTGAL